MVGQLNPGVQVLGLDLDQNLFPSTTSFGAPFCFNLSFNIYVGVMINDYHCHLRGEGGGVFTKELHNSHACRSCL